MLPEISIRVTGTMVKPGKSELSGFRDGEGNGTPLHY